MVGVETERYFGTFRYCIRRRNLTLGKQSVSVLFKYKISKLLVTMTSLCNKHLIQQRIVLLVLILRLRNCGRGSTLPADGYGICLKMDDQTW